MTLEEFINKVTEEIKNYLPKEYADGEIHIFDQSLVGGCCKAMTITVPQHTLEHMVYLDTWYTLTHCMQTSVTERLLPKSCRLSLRLCWILHQILN